MERVGIRQLQQNASAVVARAAAGEALEITDRGRAVARLVPIRKNRVAELIDAGLASPARRHVKDLPPPLVLRDGEPTLSELLAEDRAEDR